VKPQYTKKIRPSWSRKTMSEIGDERFYYVHRHGGYYRSIHTFPEIRRNVGDATDYRDVAKFARARRNNGNLNSWNDFGRSRQYKASWKDFTRYKKQWMVSSDPKPTRF
jgi:hypothetical protein